MKTEKKRQFIPTLYPYSYEDKSTWAYLGCLVSGSDKNPLIKWIKNPEFKYSHLIKNY